MAKVQVLNVAVLDNPSPFGNPFQFEITFECMEDLPEGELTAYQLFFVNEMFVLHFVYHHVNYPRYVISSFPPS